jgi:hypothetical protein
LVRNGAAVCKPINLLPLSPLVKAVVFSSGYDKIHLSIKKILKCQKRAFEDPFTERKDLIILLNQPNKKIDQFELYHHPIKHSMNYVKFPVPTPS